MALDLLVQGALALAGQLPTLSPQGLYEALKVRFSEAEQARVFYAHDGQGPDGRPIIIGKCVGLAQAWLVLGHYLSAKLGPRFDLVLNEAMRIELADSED
jgi:hypothetical protein